MLKRSRIHLPQWVPSCSSSIGAIATIAKKLTFFRTSSFNLNHPLSFAKKEENGAMELQKEKKA
jgi:hypothetical protein